MILLLLLFFGLRAVCCRFLVMIGLLMLKWDRVLFISDPPSELMTREQLRTAIKLVRNLQLENWIRFPIFAKHNEAVMAARFMKIVEKMDEMIPSQPPVDYTTYQTFLKTDFMKFKSHYSGIEWNSLVARLTRIYIFYEHYKTYIYNSKNA